jgi:hypothetical protein
MDYTMTMKDKTIIALSSVVGIAVLVYVSKDREIRNFLDVNENFVGAFLMIGAVLLFITSLVYHRTLDFLDEETYVTLKIVRINIVLWSIFWICWTVLNVLLLFQYPITTKMIIFSFLMATLPGIAFFLFAVWLRKDMLKSGAYSDENCADKFEGYKKLSALRYFVGFYGIITVPVYLITMAACYLIK